ncbi:hypothetical protein [Massilia glaciei]|uniref:hypothetical protein n=1 Tax=Massilia glaciei TaxID=1524097 RepID=UPI0011B1F20C|nr:hypothetical protein [Massilia glaciei]
MATIVASIISGIVALSTGNEAFIFADLLGISVATWLSFCAINSPSATVVARRLLELAQKKAGLLADERHILSELNERFSSEKALRERRSKQRISGVSLGVFLFIALIYLLISQIINGFAEAAIALVVGAFALALVWGIMNAEWGKVELEIRLQKVRRELEKLSK